MISYLLNIISSLFSIHFVINIIYNIIYVKRIYNYSSARKKTMDIIDALNELQKPYCFKFGREMFHNKSVPLLVLSFETISFATCEMAFSGMILNIVVYRFRWGDVKGEPLIPDNYSKQILNEDTIKIIEKTNRDSFTSEEVVIPPYGIPDKIIKRCYKVANTIVDEYKSNMEVSKVYMLHGYPGCGKTTTLRIITGLVKGILFPEYNATDSTLSIRDIINDWKSDETTLVVAFEEFDIYFKDIVNKKTISTAKQKPDAFDKSSWNSMLDYLKRKKNLIYIMLTNKSIEDIQEMYQDDFSYLRKGRVDAHFIWPDSDNDNDIVKRKEPIDACRNDYLEHKNNFLNNKKLEEVIMESDRKSNRRKKQNNIKLYFNKLFK